MDANAVIFQPDFPRPYERSGQNVEISATGRKSFEFETETGPVTGVALRPAAQQVSPQS
jgi:hypothetical protein